MKWQTCFSSECDSGYSICAVKSAMQKFLRRRMPSEMKWCVLEMYKFKSMASNEKELKISKGIITNLLNRLTIMLDEELLFAEWHVYLKARELIKNGDLESLYKVCDILCESRLLRYSSDVACYFMKAVLGKNPNYNMEEVSNAYEVFDKFKLALENDKVEEVYYYAFVLFMNKNGELVESKSGKILNPSYLIWSYLLQSNKVVNNENLKKSIEYKFAEYHKERGEKKMFLVAALSLYMYSDRIDWSIDWENVKSVNNYELIEGIAFKIPDFAIDMHCRAGRILGKNQADFAKEGSLVINEDKEYFNPLYREFYNKCKMEDAELGVKINKVKKEKVVKIKDEKVGCQRKKNLFIIEDDEEEKVVKEKKVKKVVKEKVVKEKVVKEKKYIAKLPAKDQLEFISMNDMKMVKLCLPNPCGNKVMCFVVEYQGKEYVLKEGRKSMNYNEDYEVFDNMKEIFGLNKIGMRRIFSDKIMEKVDKSKKEWTDNWQFIEKENVVYSMMEYIKGVKFNKAGKVTKEMELEYMKIGLFRGIFMVSDFNVTNVFVVDNTLYSIDEHDILGKREKMIGDKNMRFYKKYSSELDNIFMDLYANKEEKKAKIVDVLNKFNYGQFIGKIMENYDNLRERFNNEYK